ncbi:AAA family ATPase [Natrialba hulunbeirensis JCM 10989]|uniref:AAA family ATPase n=1 Tax=Natrialba hulunbeirensis JCM 10989 TaxID=1227493 RepID=M0A191_9EURY|nr:ATP-binding protein [Natrialba hulunbeirensis]ELY91133.1 AAA family ATPase [Natrialba hulunbeirensis JCM 10989]
MYDHAGDHLQAEFDRLQWLFKRLLAERDSRGETRTSAGQFVPVASRIRAVSSGDGTVTDSGGDLRAELAARAEQIDADVTASREAGVDLPLETIKRAFDLSRAELDVLLIVLAPEFDRSITTTYGKICGVNSAQYPSIDLLERVRCYLGDDCECDDPSAEHSALLSPSSPLFEYDLLERTPRDPGRPASFDTLTVDDRIVRYLKGYDSLGPPLSEHVTIESHERTPEDLVFPEETANVLEGIAARSRDSDRPTIYYLSGEDGTGKDRLPGALTDPETPILRADGAAVLENDLLTRLCREAALQDAAIHLEGLETVTGRDDGPTVDDGEETITPSTADDYPSIDALVERMDDAPGDVFLSYTEPWTPDVNLTTHRLETCDCPFPEYETRLAVWEEYTAEFADETLPAVLATNFRLPQRDIRRAVRTARYLCRTDGGTGDRDEANRDVSDDCTDAPFDPVDGALEREHLYEACKRYSATTLESLAESLEPGYTWEDISLNDKPMTHLQELAGHLQYRGPVTSEWGFGEPGSRGDGIVALFYGQPGTGKTMAAEIIAAETGLDLYRVDLSQVINKYIGETESRLATLLDEAERSNAILLFDEADAIFGKRAEVTDATDRYANTEINFLLQRLESFDGILLLTTNKETGIDPAFKRRIDHSIQFDKPQELIRRELWRDAFPEGASVDTETFDYEFLGRIAITPALIRKVAKYAAYIAATQAHEGRVFEAGSASAGAGAGTGPNSLADVTITFEHVILALQYAREAGGGGFEVDFREYDDKRRSYDSASVDRDWRAELKRTYGEESAGKAE